MRGNGTVLWRCRIAAAAALIRLFNRGGPSPDPRATPISATSF